MLKKEVGNLFKKNNNFLLVFVCLFIVANDIVSFATNVYERNISNGYIVGKSEKIYFENGDMMDLTGTIHHKDGSETLPLGTVKDMYGITHYPDGTIKLPDGTIYYINGQIEYAENAQALIIQNNMLEEEKRKAAASDTGVNSWEYNPVANNWRYVEKNESDTKSYNSRWITVNNDQGVPEWYAVDMDGNMITGWVKHNGRFYYMSSDPATRGEMVKGIAIVDGKKYEFDINTGELIDGDEPTRGFEVLEADNHQSGKDGMWRRNKNGERYFTYYSKTITGQTTPVLPTGWFMIDGRYYFFGENGVPKTGLIIFDDKYYYMNEDGTMKEGGQVVIDNTIYEFDKSTGACISMITF